MQYRTVDEWNHFSFENAEIFEIVQQNGHLILNLGYVTILGSNSCNRDIRDMGTNELTLQLHSARIISLTREGYKIYDADGALTETVEDEIISPERYEQTWTELQNATVYSLTVQDDIYTFSMDTLEDTFVLIVKARHDVEQWDRFMNKDIGY